jgi:hypothetical protein
MHRHVIKRILNTRLSSKMAAYDMASKSMKWYMGQTNKSSQAGNIVTWRALSHTPRRRDVAVHFGEDRVRLA